MTFRYRSPNDKSILTGGLSSIASFNEPVSQCPEAGILLRTVDTSRWVSDYIGQQFYMPYSTSFYTNGTCGESSVETWGLQYLPAGYVTGTYTSNISNGWSFVTYDNSTTDGSLQVGYDTYNLVEDGTGINTAVNMGTTYTYPAGYVAVYNDGYTDRWRVYWDGNGTYSLNDFTMYPSYGNYLNESTGPASLYVYEVDSYAQAGTAYISNYSDGYGGAYGVTNYIEWYAQGTVIATFNQYPFQSQDPDNGIYYDNGQYTFSTARVGQGGGYYYVNTGESGGSFYDNGTYIRTVSSEPNYTYWNASSFSNGTTSDNDRVWDGYGWFTTVYGVQRGSCYANDTFIGGGYYDNNGNGPYDLRWNGYCGINEYYQGGSTCDSYGTYYGISCQSSSGYDVAGNYFTGNWDAFDAYADGSCGTMYSYNSSNSNGCYYPYGFYTTYNTYPSYGNWYVYDSSSNLVAYNSFVYADYGDYAYSDGSGGSITGSFSWSWNNGDQISNGDFWDSNLSTQVYYTVYYDGNGGYYVTYSS